MCGSYQPADKCNARIRESQIGQLQSAGIPLLRNLLTWPVPRASRTGGPIEIERREEEAWRIVALVGASEDTAV